LKPYTKIYFSYFGYDISSYIACEVCEVKRAVDIHHIESRGMGGTTKKDTIENIMALCRECHVNLGDKKEFKEYLKEIHLKKL